MLVKQKYGEVRDELKDLKSQVRDGLEEVRKIIFNLRPMALDDLGVVPTVRKFVQDFEEKKPEYVQNLMFSVENADWLPGWKRQFSGWCRKLSPMC